MQENPQNVEMMKFQVEIWHVSSAHSIDVATPAVMAYALVFSGPNSVTNVLDIMGVKKEPILKSLEEMVKISAPAKRRVKADDNTAVSLTSGGREIMKVATDVCSLMGDPFLNTHHVMLAILKSDAALSKTFAKHGVSFSGFRSVVRQTAVPPVQAASPESGKKEMVSDPPGQNPTDAQRKPQPANDKEVLAKYCKDLTDLAKHGKLDPVIGRDKEISRLITTLCRRKKNNAILVGEPGVGKTAVVEGFAQRVVAGTVPPQMKDCKVFQLNMTSIVSRTTYRGQFEERMRAVMELFAANKEYVLFIDEIHTLIGSGGSVGGLDTANIMKPALAGGSIRCVGATTEDEYRRFFKKDGALDRRFQRVFIDEPSKDETCTILIGIKQVIEAHHACVIPDEVLRLAVDLSARYVTDRFLPDKAIDCLDEACSTATSRSKGNSEKVVITKDDIVLAIACQTDMPIEVVGISDANRARSLKSFLKDRIIGQNVAVDSVSSLLMGAFAGIRDMRRPIGCFVFGGTTGSGTTFMAEKMAEGLFESSASLVRINMSEFSAGFGPTKLVGCPPGYLGYGESNQLTDKIMRRPYCLILLDGIENADESVIRLFMSAISKGVMTDGAGKEVNFRNSVIIMTMNLDLMSKSGGLGFSDDILNKGKDGMRECLVEECRTMFGDDFVNHVDEFIPFVRLEKKDVIEVAKRRLDGLASKISELGIVMSYSDEVVASVVDGSVQTGHPNPKIVDRYVRRHIEPAVSEFLADRDKAEGSLRLIMTDGHVSCVGFSVMAAAASQD